MNQGPGAFAALEPRTKGQFTSLGTGEQRERIAAPFSKPIDERRPFQNQDDPILHEELRIIRLPDWQRHD